VAISHGTFKPDDPAGVEPVRMHVESVRRPCKRQSPRQERSARRENQPLPDTDRRRESRKGLRSPEANPISRRSNSGLTPGHRITRRKSIGARVRTNRHVGPGDSEMIRPPDAGANLRRALIKNPRSVAGRAEGRTTRSARPRRVRIGSGTPRKSMRRCMTDVGPANENCGGA